MISAAKRKQLEEAGYKVSKSGKTVQTKSGGTVAGINKNGNLFGSADSKAFKILKGEGKVESDTKDREKPKERSTKTTAPSRSSSAPTESKRPKQRQKGRGEPNYGEPKASSSGPSTRQSNKPSKTNDKEETTLLRSSDKRPSNNILERVQDKRTKAKETLSKRRAEERATERKQESAPSFKDFMNEKRRADPDRFREDPKGFTDKMREMYKQKFGFNKGGMVRKGNTNYKDKGMFYKSASPRGYK